MSQTIDEILEAAEKATPGPWELSGYCHVDMSYHIGPEVEGHKTGIHVTEHSCIEDLVCDVWSDSEAAKDEANAILVAGAPQLATEVLRLRERVKELESEVATPILVTTNRLVDQLADSRERERVMTEAPWYLLFDGSSDDGRGEGQYIGRTTDKNVAMKHYSKCKSNPYSTGKVIKITSNSYARLSDIFPEKEL